MGLGVGFLQFDKYVRSGSTSAFGVDMATRPPVREDPSIWVRLAPYADEGGKERQRERGGAREMV